MAAKGEKSTNIKRLGISTIYWNHDVSYGHCLNQPYGMMEYWNVEDPPLEDWKIGSEKRKKVYLYSF